MEKMVDYGYVERTHGLKGRIVLKLFILGSAVPLEEGTVINAGDSKLTVTRSRKRDNERITVDCKEIWTIAQADDLRGRKVTVEESAVLRDGFPFPVYSLEGFTICSDDNRFSVVEVEFNTTNPQLIVQGVEKTFPVPMNMALAGEVNTKERTISVQLPEGLEEL